MKGILLLIFCIIAAVLIIGGAAAVGIMHEVGVDEFNADTIKVIFDKITNRESSVSSDSSSDSGNVISDIVNEEVKENHQNGEGSYREVTYSDGGFRQYDTESGELIGSSYDSDQDKLPSME